MTATGAPDPGTAATSTSTSTGPPESTPPTTAGPSASNAGGVSGSVIRRSDVQSVPDQTVTAGVVVIVPEADVGSFWAAVNLPSTGPPVLGKAEFLVDPSSLPSSAAVATIEGGRFSSDVVSPAVLLCLADDLPGDEQGPPFHASGCARYEGSGEVRLSSGLGGVRADRA